jgi:hypothetical protein
LLSKVRVKFPGSRLLHHWELGRERLFSIDDLLRSCRHVHLTGYAEITFPQAAAMLFFYAGSAVNALYRRAPLALHGREALDRLRAQIGAEEGTIDVYQMPLEIAHLLRGITQRRKLPETIDGPLALAALLERLLHEEHTGTLELQPPGGTAMVLLVGGHVSNTYWETDDGLTFEQPLARARLEAALTGARAPAFLSVFSRETWRARPEAQEIGALFDACTPPGDPDDANAFLRDLTLANVQAELPSCLHSLIFDLPTGLVLARRTRSATSLKVAPFADRVPPLTLFLREMLAIDVSDDVESIQISTHGVAITIAAVPQVLEALAVLADGSQPPSVLAAALEQEARLYARRRTAPSPGGSAEAADVGSLGSTAQNVAPPPGVGAKKIRPR